MRSCPLCNRVYADQAVNFCLVDGTPLSTSTAHGSGGTAPASSVRATDAPTEQMPGAARAAAPTLPVPPPQFARPVYAPVQPQPRGGRDRKALLWSIIVILAGSVAVLTYLLVRKDSGETQERTASAAGNSSEPGVNASPVAIPSIPSPLPSLPPSPTPFVITTPVTTATPAPNVEDARAEVSDLMDSWAESLRRQDADANLSLYADSLDSYYTAGSVGKERVRADRERIFAKYYSSTDVQLSNVSVQVNSDGTSATVTYDNSYNWRGGSKYLKGKSHNQMELSRVGSRWLITGERHLSTYFEDSGG